MQWRLFDIYNPFAPWASVSKRLWEGPYAKPRALRYSSCTSLSTASLWHHGRTPANYQFPGFPPPNQGSCISVLALVFMRLFTISVLIFALPLYALFIMLILDTGLSVPCLLGISRRYSVFRYLIPLIFSDLYPLHGRYKFRYVFC